jgi:hypothetical protein
MADEDDNSLTARAVRAVMRPALSYVDWIQKPRPSPFPAALDPYVRKADDALRYRPVDPEIAKQRELDRQIEENRRAIETAKRYAQPPQDIGDIDEPMVRPGSFADASGVNVDPNVRQPIQMERTFSNDADKDAYIEQVRKAQQNAGK